MLTRRELLKSLMLGSLAPALAVAGSEENASLNKLVSPRMREYILLQDDELVVEPTWSSLDSYFVTTADLRDCRQFCADFLFSLTGSAIEFNALHCPCPDYKAKILQLDDWQHVGGWQDTYRLFDGSTAVETIQRSKGYLRRLRELVGARRDRTQPVVIDADVLRLARAFQRIGILDRERTSPFSHATFRRRDWSGTWMVGDKIWTNGLECAERRSFHQALREQGAQPMLDWQNEDVPYESVLCAIGMGINE